MPVRLLRYPHLNLAAWDACVAAAPQVVPYACSWWLQATAGRWDALVDVDDATGRYLAVWPLPVKRRPWGREVYQPPFTQQLGVVGEGHLLQETDGLRGYAHFYTQLNDANLPPARVPAAPNPGGPPVGWEWRRTYHLALHQPYAALRAGYAPDYRRRLRLNEAAAVPLVVVPLASTEPLVALFRETKGAAAGLKARHYAALARLLQALRARQLLDVRAVHHPETGALLAAALFVRYRSRLVYLFAAASAEGKKAAAPLLLVDDAIRRHAGTPGLVLDFEGGMIPFIARFFANFGAAPVPYAALSFTQRPWFLKWMR